MDIPPGRRVDVARREVLRCPPDAAIQQVARQLNENAAETVVVIDPEGRPVGIVTHRDIVRRAVAKGIPVDSPVRLIMSTEVATIREDGDAIDAARQMASRECRRLPVVDDSGRVVGLVEFDDIFDLVHDSLDALALVVRHEHHPSVARVG